MENKEMNDYLDKVAEAIFRDMLSRNKPCSIQQLNPPCTMEFLADADHVSIPTSRFEALVRAEEQRDIVRRAYQTNCRRSWRMDEILELVFGKPEVKGNAQ